MRSFAHALPIAVAVLVTSTACSCTTVRQLRPAESIPADAPAQRTRSEDALDYSVAKTIQAPPAAVWALLTDAPGYLKWNTTLVKLDGTISVSAWPSGRVPGDSSAT